MSLTLFPRGQLLAGLIALLAPKVADLLPASNILSGWEDKRLMVSLAQEPNSAILVINLEKSVPSKITSNPQSGRNAQSKSKDADGNVTLLTEVLREDVPVRFIIQTNGLSGKTKGQMIQARLLSILGGACDVPLPDSLEAIPLDDPASSIVDPTQTDFGLQARLTFLGTYPVDNDDAAQEYRYDVLYTASISNFSVTTAPLVTEFNPILVIRR